MTKTLLMLSLETSIEVSASIQEVWSALTQPEIVAQYFWGTQLDTTWYVGDPIYFRGEWEGTPYEDKGIVTAFEPLKSLRFTYWSSWSKKPDLPENYANVEYLVEAIGNKTKVTVKQDGMENEEMVTHSEKNWQFVLEQMKKLLEEAE